MEHAEKGIVCYSVHMLYPDIIEIFVLDAHRCGLFACYCVWFVVSGMCCFLHCLISFIVQ